MSFMDIFRAGGRPPIEEAEITQTANIPNVEDSVKDSGSTFFFGRSNAGPMVNETSSMQIATVYACVRLLAETIASLPLHLYKKTDNYRVLANDHPLYKLLLDEPNTEMSSFTFVEAIMTHLLLWGNGYAQIVRSGRGEILGLYPLLPDQVEVDRDPSTKELIYIYHNTSDETGSLDESGDVIFKKEEILHIPGLSFNGLVGFSPIAMMKNALGSAIAVERYGIYCGGHGTGLCIPVSSDKRVLQAFDARRYYTWRQSDTYLDGWKRGSGAGPGRKHQMRKKQIA